MAGECVLLGGQMMAIAAALLPGRGSAAAAVSPFLGNRAAAGTALPAADSVLRVRMGLARLPVRCSVEVSFAAPPPPSGSSANLHHYLAIAKPLPQICSFEVLVWEGLERSF